MAENLHDIHKINRQIRFLANILPIKILPNEVGTGRGNACYIDSVSKLTAIGSDYLSSCPFRIVPDIPILSGTVLWA